jgi:hypothetical protein
MTSPAPLGVKSMNILTVHNGENQPPKKEEK